MDAAHHQNPQPGVIRLDYLIASADTNLDKIDKWYERDAGETFGKWVFYRLKLK